MMEAAENGFAHDAYPAPRPLGAIDTLAHRVTYPMAAIPTQPTRGPVRYIPEFRCQPEAVERSARIRSEFGAKLMYKHLLVPLDRSKSAERALATALPLAEACGARVSLVTAVEDAPVGLTLPEPARSAWRAEAADYLAHLEERLPQHQALVTTHVLNGDAALAIERFVSEHDVDAVVMGTHGAHSERALPLGGTAWKLLQTLPIAVLLVPSRAAPAAIEADR